MNASQVRTNRAAFTDASMSSTPASAAGWLPTTPTGWPPSRANPQTMFSAKRGCTSRNSPSSTTFAITCFMSYGFVGLVRDERVQLGVLTVDRVGRRRVRRRLEVVLGQEREQVARVLEARLLVGAVKCATPDFAACVVGAAELLERDLLARDRLHDVGAGDEHVRAALDHQRRSR